LISLIILAAGSSTRFGRNKLLEKIDGTTIIERVVRSAVFSKADEVIVVLGYEASKVREALKNFEHKCKFVFNEDFEKGQSFSVKAGLRAVIDYAEAVMILPGDVAFITSKAIDMVIEEYRRSKNLIVVASHKGRLGHPILFDRRLFNELMEIREETMGLKAVVKKYKEVIKKVEVGSEEVLIDIDTEEDLKKHLRRFKHR
jgi:molybdenum cofactor cytidylyltransferase